MKDGIKVEGLIIYAGDFAVDGPVGGAGGLMVEAASWLEIVLLAAEVVSIAADVAGRYLNNDILGLG